MNGASEKANCDAYLERIRNRLGENVPLEEALQLTKLISNAVLTVDLLLAELLSDPEVFESCDYDGQFFTPKKGYGWNRAFNGERILQSIDSRLDCFLEKPSNLRKETIEELLDIHVFEIQARLSRWKEYRTLRLFPSPMLAEMMEAYRTTTPEHTTLPEEEQRFFATYESQLGVRT